MLISTTERNVLQRSSSLALLLFFVFTCRLSYSQPNIAATQNCGAQILTIEGEWIARSDGISHERSLAKWSCVNEGEELILARTSQRGSITIIYHRGAKEPDTLKCKDRAECRNAYRVKQPVIAVPPPSGLDKLLDFFFSPFRDEPKPVPGILQGKIPTLKIGCSQGKSIIAPGIFDRRFSYSLTVVALNEEADRTHWRPYNIDEFELDWMSIETDGFWTMDHPLKAPALYHIDAKGTRKEQKIQLNDEIAVLLIIEPESVCDQIAKSNLTTSYKTAREYTKKWPREAARDFLVRYSQK